MTPMTENTPMVMPSMVRIERSLFTPIEAKAILRISDEAAWLDELSPTIIRGPMSGSGESHS